MNRRRRDVAGAYPAVCLPGNRILGGRRDAAPSSGTATSRSRALNGRSRVLQGAICGHPRRGSQDLLPVPSGGCSVRNRLQRPHGSRPVLSFDRPEDRGSGALETFPTGSGCASSTGADDIHTCGHCCGHVGGVLRCSCDDARTAGSGDGHVAATQDPCST